MIVIFCNRCGIGLPGSNESMADLMIRDDELLLVGEYLVLLLVTGDDYFHAFLQICLGDEFSSVPDCPEGAFIDNVSQFCAGCTCGHTGNGIEVDGICQLYFFRMYLQNIFPPFEIRQLYRYAAVKTAGTQQGGIQCLRAVGGSQNDQRPCGRRSRPSR